MPVGATIGAAVVGAGASIYSSSKASKAQSKAANTASDLSLQVAQTNNAFAQSMYDQNAARLDPFITGFGLPAGDEIMGLLLGHAPAPGATTSPNGYYTPPPPANSSGGGTGTGTSSSLAEWANGAIAAMAPNITRSSTWQHANTIADPYQRLQYILSQSPADSDQYPLYQAYVSAHPQPSATAPAPTPTPTPAPAPSTVPPGTAASAIPAQQRLMSTTSPVALSANNTLASAAPQAVTPTANALAPHTLNPDGSTPQPQGAVDNIAAQHNSAFVPLAGRVGTRPVIADFKLPSGQYDRDAYNAAVEHWKGTPQTPTPAAGGTPTPTPTGTPTPTPGTGTGTTPNNALSAWDTFRNSTNYKFRLDQGLEGVNTKYAAMGAIESGAAMKAIDEYSQNFASNELANYMDQLYRQEALGASAASSLAGVGTNLVSQVAANNNNAANAAGNAALVNGQGQANQWGTIGNAVGTAAGAIGGAFGTSYGNNWSSPSAVLDF